MISTKQHASHCKTDFLQLLGHFSQNPTVVMSRLPYRLWCLLRPKQLTSYWQHPQRRVCTLLLCVLLLWSVCYIFHIFSSWADISNYPLNVDLYKIYRARSGVPGEHLTIIPPVLNRIQFKPLISKNPLCSKDQSDSVIILVKTVHEKTEQRQQIRDTWANPLCGKRMGVRIQTFFVLGELGSSFSTERSIKLKQLVQEEQIRHQDIILFNFTDHYQNNTYKVMAALEYVEQMCSQASYVVLMDDDVLVHPINLIKTIQSVSPSHYSTYIAGRVYPQSMPRRFPWSKWYLSYQDYPYIVFPAYVTGGTVIMSMPVLRLLNVGLRYTKLLFVDDILMGIILHKLGIRPVHLLGVHINTDWFYTPDNRAISIHGYSDPKSLAYGWKQFGLRSDCSSVS